MVNSTVLMAVDNSQHSQHCLKFYVDRLHRPGNKLIVLHVPEYWGDMARMMSPARLQEVWNETQQNTKALEVKFREEAQKSGINDFEFVKEDGKEPWSIIVEKAKEKKADFIVMGSRGMGTVRRTLMGSVSDGVVHHSHIPVMVVRE